MPPPFMDCLVYLVCITIISMCRKFSSEPSASTYEHCTSFEPCVINPFLYFFSRFKGFKVIGFELFFPFAYLLIFFNFNKHQFLIIVLIDS